MSSTRRSFAEVRLTCQPHKEGGTLVFPYQVENAGPDDVYLADALPGVDRQTGDARANDQAPVVVLGPNEEAIIGRFVAPLPTDRRVAVPVLPLTRRLPAGQVHEGRLMVTLPLAECSPYFSDLLLRRYEMLDIKGVTFVIGYWLAGADGLAALPVDYAPDLFTVVTRQTIRSEVRVLQRFPTRGLQIFKRTDEFPRDIGGIPATAGESEPVSVGGVAARLVQNGTLT